MKTEFLEGLFKESGVAEDKIKELINKVLAENGKDIAVEQGKTTAETAKLTTAENAIKGLQEAVKKFDGVDVTKLQDDFKTLQKKYDDDIKTEQQKTADLKKGYDLKEKLRDLNITDPDYLIFKHGGIEKFNFDKDGNLIGLEDTVKPYKELIPHIFKESKTNYNPAGGGDYKGANPFAKESFNLTEQGKLLKENPAQAKELASAAGVTI